RQGNHPVLQLLTRATQPVRNSFDAAMLLVSPNPEASSFLQNSGPPLPFRNMQTICGAKGQLGNRLLSPTLTDGQKQGQIGHLPRSHIFGMAWPLTPA